MTYAEALRQIVADYRGRIAAYEQAELQLRATNAEFAESERKRRDLLLKQAKGEKIPSTTLDKVIEENQKIRQKLRLVPPEPHCAKCADTGRVNGKFCDCVISLAAQSQTDTRIPLHKFEDVDFSVYGDDSDKYRKLFGYVEKICACYPLNKKRCIVLGGLTGTGKTYLAGCAAQKISERGMSVTALTAFAANNRFLKYHTCFDGNKASYLDPMLDAALLIIDDLGTESILKNVTAEYLYQIINERNVTGKLTIVTTNLTPNRLLTRYGERIYSRLFDKSLSLSLYLEGNDLRKGF